MPEEVKEFEPEGPADAARYDMGHLVRILGKRAQPRTEKSP